MLGLKKGTVKLAPHDMEWDAEARRMVTRLYTILGKTAIDIEHIGSTAIRGIRAKPIIDIAVAVGDLSDILPLIPTLEENGFYRRNVGDDTQVFFVCGDLTTELRTHHIHVVTSESVAWRNYLLFRDYLNVTPRKASEYEALKRDLAKRFPNDRESYTSGKSSYIADTLRRAFVWSYLGKTITVTVDRPLGSAHPENPELIYPVNYGYLDGVIGGDGEMQDVYILGIDTPREIFKGQIIGAVMRENDKEDKLIAAPVGLRLHQAEIAEKVAFQEKYYKTTVESLFRKSCGAILYRMRNGKREYLLLLQKKSRTWSFPKGHMEIGENERMTARREVKEEVGFRIGFDKQFRTAVRYSVSSKTEKEVVLFLSKINMAPRIPLREIATYRFVSAEEAKRLLPRGYTSVINDAEAYLDSIEEI